MTLLIRPRSERAYSIEAVFGTVVEHLPNDIHARVVVSPHPSQGLLPRLRGILHAMHVTRGADVVHMTGDAHYLVLGLPRRRTVLTVHDCEFLERARGFKRFLLWLIWLCLPAWRVAMVTTVSRESRAQLLRWLRLNPARVAVIGNPLAKALTRDDRAFCAVCPRLLMIGAGPHKNVDRVAQAVSGLPVILEVIGQLDEARLALLRAAGLAIETRHDLTEAELAQAYARADILVYPSLAEGFGLPILEAQSVGRPVITSNRAPMREVAGDAALLVDPEDAGAIRAAVERLVGDPDLRARLVAAGFKNVAQYGPEHAAAHYADLYRRVAAGAA